MAVLPGYGIRVTMFFDDGRTGWSETHYDTVRTTLTGAIGAAVANLIPARVQCLALGPYLKYVRASRDGVFRDAQISTIPGVVNVLGPGYVNNPRWAATDAAVEWTACLLRGVGGDLYRKQIYLSGVPFPDPTDIGDPQNDPILVAAIQAYSAILVLNGYGFPVWTRDPVAVPPVQINTIAPNVGGTGYLFTCAAPHGLPNTWNPVATTWRAFLHGMRFDPSPGTVIRPRPSPNGGYPFTVVGANTFVLPTWVFPGPNLTNNYTYVGGSGSVQAQQRAVSTYQQANGVVIERFTHRKRGRPFDSPVGRSRARQIFAFR